MIGFVELHGSVLYSCGDGPSFNQSAFLAVNHSDFVIARHVDEQPGSRLFQRHRLETIRIFLDNLYIRELLVAPRIHNADETIRCMGFAATVHDVEEFLRGIVNNRVRIDRQRDVPDQIVRLIVDDLNL